MNPNRYVAAIDIGTTKIVAVIGQKEVRGGVRILGLGNTPSKGVRRGVVLNIEETVQSIRAAVDDVQKMSGIKLTDVYVGIAGQHIKSLRNRGCIDIIPPDREISNDDVISLMDDMRKIPVEAGDQILHVLPQSFIVDQEIGLKNPVGMTGKKMEGNFHIVIGQTSSANNIKRCIQRVGLNVVSLILEPLASAKAVITEDEKEVGVAMIDIGGGTTDIAVYYDGIIRHTAVIPIGGNTVTQDIKNGCLILERQAELAKVKYGSAIAECVNEEQVITIPGLKGRDPREISFQTLAYIIQARMEEIIGAVFFQLESSGFIDKLGAGVVLTGGGALLKNLPQLFSYKTGMDVRIGYPNEYLTSDIGDSVNQPMFSTSIGLILKGYEHTDMMNRKVETGRQEETVEEVEVVGKQTEEEEEVKEKEKAISKNGLFYGWKEKIGNIFEEKDIQ